LSPDFKSYAERIVANAKALCEAIIAAGLVVVSGGTDNHLFLVSLVDRDTTGKMAQTALDRAGVTTNKNMVPFDPRKPMVTSGLRIGTPAVTTRGMGELEMVEIAGFIARILERPGDVEQLDAVRREVEVLCRRFPLYTKRWNESD
jgi:glycine hydroxymethyltransferase